MAKVLVQRRGQVAVVTINRPEVHNAIDAETADLLGAAIDAFADDVEAQVLVVTGAGGRAFSSGADLLGLAGLLSRSDLDRTGPLGFAKLDPGKPTIAAVEGYCFAGGMELACWCDFRIVGATAEFGILNRRWGVPLIDGGTQRLPRIVGLATALYLIETGARIDAVRAREFGLVQEIVPAGEALARAVELAEAIIRYPSQSLLADRGNTLAAHGRSLPDGLAAEGRSGLAAATAPEMMAGLRRFADGDRPEPPRPR